MEMRHFVYVIQSEKDGRRYIGYTTDVEKRLMYHNEGLNKSTKNRGPFKLIYKEERASKSEALKRERLLKRQKGGVTLTKVLRSFGRE